MKIRSALIPLITSTFVYLSPNDIATHNTASCENIFLILSQKILQMFVKLFYKFFSPRILDKQCYDLPQNF
jgi:hypothetical protein